ncbi:MAG: hemerythrin domain-containing protein [Nitrospirae bacterium]|nr:hemerythrin domain-containing protein [Nitrospirota bacterium]
MQTPSATKQLGDEHRRVWPLLDDLASIVDSLRSGSADEGSVRRCAEAVRKIEDELDIHLLREEKILFPPLEAFLPRDSGPLAVMLAEHDDLRRDEAKMKELLAAGPGSSAAQLREVALRFVGVLKAHIQKEDNILFPMAEMHLSASDKERIARELPEFTQVG